MTTTAASREIVLSLPRPHTAQRRVLREAKRYNVLACGRRWGKSTLAVELAARPALASHPVGYFAPTYKLLIEYWTELLRTLRPILRRSNANERRIELITGGVIECWTLEDPDAGRSRRYRRAIVDEAGLVRTLGETWQTAIRPTLADYSGDAWLMGTPKGRNFFWECYRRGMDPLQPEWQAWQMPTSANPFIPPAEIAAMQSEMLERRYQQEIEAAFLEESGGVFRNVRRAATATPQGRAQDGHQYVIGVDWGRTSDATVFSVIDVATREQVALDRMTATDYMLQASRLEALWERFGRCAVIAEANSMGGPMIEYLSRKGLRVRAFTTTNATKADAIDALALAFERETLRILPDEVQITELEAYEGERLPSGLIRYSAPEGLHDDCVMSLAIAYSGVGRASSVVGAFA